jgi:hypothetical protein
MTELQKLYTIDVTRHDKKTGEIYARYDLGLVPMTHKEACTLIGKQSRTAGRGFIIVDFPRTDGLNPPLC